VRLPFVVFTVLPVGRVARPAALAASAVLAATTALAASSLLSGLLDLVLNLPTQRLQRLVDFASISSRVNWSACSIC
jgi:hypothetical protein